MFSLLYDKIKSLKQGCADWMRVAWQDFNGYRFVLKKCKINCTKIKILYILDNVIMEYGQKSEHLASSKINFQLNLIYLCMHDYIYAILPISQWYFCHKWSNNYYMFKIKDNGK